MFIIYDCNDRALYYKTTILDNLSIAKSVNYDCELYCKLKSTITIVNYDRKTFVEQVKGWKNFISSWVKYYKTFFIV